MRTVFFLGFIALALFLFPTSTHAQDRVAAEFVGDWSGAIHIQGVELKIVTHFTSSGATIDIPQQMAMGLPLQNVSASTDSVYFELQAGPGLAVFNGAFADGVVEGTFEQAGMIGRFDLARMESNAVEASDAQDDGRAGESVVVELSDGLLAGTLLTPETAGPHPLVILVAGSGPTDRDGNSIGAPGKNNSLRLLAEALNDHGIATIRYDKRGVSESVPSISEIDLRIDSFSVDVERWVNFAKADGRFDPIVLAGHSEGALLVALAAPAASDDVDGVISIAGAGRPASEVLHEQLAVQLPPEMLAQADQAMAKLSRGETTSDYPQALESLFRPSVQPYLISWFAHDPAAVLAAVDLPKLILQGDTDIQIAVEDAERLKSLSGDAELRVIPGMNHVLKMVSDDRAKQLASYTDPALPVAPELVQAIVQFVDSVAH